MCAGAAVYGEYDQYSIDQLSNLNLQHIQSSKKTSTNEYIKLCLTKKVIRAL